jgi:SAM-dependent methyltransferase
LGERFRFLFKTSDRMHGCPGVFDVLRCETCGVVSSAPRLSDEELAAYYPADYYAHADPPPPGTGWKARLRDVADDVHLGLDRNPLWRVALWPILWHKRHYSYARHLVGVKPGRLLDIGCGDAAFLLKARKLGFAATGCERGIKPSPGLAARGVVVVDSPDLDAPVPAESSGGAPDRGGAGQSGATIRVHRASLEELRGGVGAFDVVTMNHVFEHFQDPAWALERAGRLLAPGGRLLVRMPDTDSTSSRRWPAHWAGLQIPRHVYLFNRDNFRRLAERQGFRVISARKEMATLHWQWALKSRFFDKTFAAPSRLDSPLLSFALLPLAELWNALGWSDMMAVWLERVDTPEHPLPLARRSKDELHATISGWIHDPRFRPIVSARAKRDERLPAPADLTDEEIDAMVESLFDPRLALVSSAVLMAAGERAFPALFKALKDPRTLVTCWGIGPARPDSPLNRIVNLLEPLGPSESAPLLEPFLGSEHPHLRKEATRGIAAIASLEAIPALRRVLAAGDWPYFAHYPLKRALDAGRGDKAFRAALFDAAVETITWDHRPGSYEKVGLLPLLDGPRAGQEFVARGCFEPAHPLFTATLAGYTACDAALPAGIAPALVRTIPKRRESGHLDSNYKHALILLAAILAPTAKHY